MASPDPALRAFTGALAFALAWLQCVPPAFAHPPHKPPQHLSLELTSDQPRYVVGEQARLTVRLLPADLARKKLKQLELVIRLPDPTILALLSPIKHNPTMVTSPPLEEGLVPVLAELFENGTQKKLEHETKHLAKDEAKLAKLLEQLARETNPKKRRALQKEIEHLQGKIAKQRAKIERLRTPIASAELTLEVVAPDTTPPVITELTPADGAVLDHPRPTISAAYSDAESGIDPASVHLLVDGGDVTAQATVTAASVSFIPSADLADGTHTARVEVADLAGNAASAQTAFTIQTAVTPPVTPQSGFLHGTVFDALTNAPLAGATVTVQGVTGAVQTSTAGVFVFPTQDGGSFLLTAAKTGFLPGQRHAEVLSAHDVAVHPIFLTPLDPSVTTIPVGGGTAVNSTGTVQVIIPPGALTAPLDVQATELTEDGQLPGPLPDTSFFTYAVDLQPDDAAFAAPVTVRLANGRGFAPGTPIPVGVYDFQTGAWNHESLAQVTSDGQWVAFQVLHFSPRDVNVPGIPPVGSESPELFKVFPLTPVSRTTLCAVPFGSTVCPAEGELGVEHALPGIRTLGVPRAPILVYRSLTADPSQTLGTDYLLETQPQNVDPGTQLPDATSMTLQVEGRLVTATFAGTTGLSRFGLFWDGRNERGMRVATGAYPYTLQLSNDYPATYFTAEVFGGPPVADTGVPTGERVPLVRRIAGRALIVNHLNSPFGAGWGLQGLQRVHPQPDGTVVVTDGDGSAFLFRPGPMTDLLVADFGSNTLSVIRGHGDGTFQPHQEIAVGAGPTDVAMADFDRDGLRDAAVSLRGGDAVAILRGAGGRFDPPQQIAVGDGPQVIVQADVNTDNAVDLITANQLSNDVSVLLGNGNGTFQPERRVPAGTSPVAVVVGDLNRDTHQDLVVINRDSDDATVLLGDGTGAFQAQPPVAVGRQPHVSALADFNGDTLLDLAVPNFLDQFITVLFGNGDGTFQAGRQVPLPVPPGGSVRPIAVVAGDLNGDAHPDLSVAANFLASVVILLNNGDGTFRTLQQVPSGFQPVALAVGEFNQDGIPDLAVANQVSQTAAILLGLGDGRFDPAARLPVGALPSGLAVGDLDGDATEPVDLFSGLPGEFSRLIRHRADGTWTRRLPDGTEARFDAFGRHVEMHDRNGSATAYAYDAQDRLNHIAFPGGATFTFAYDSNGRLASVTDSASRTTQVVVDANGDLVRITHPDATTRRFAYDVAHHLTAQTGERGFTTDYAYDAFGRIREAQLPARPVVDPLSGDTVAQREIRRLTPMATQSVINLLPAGEGTPANPAAVFPVPEAVLVDGRGMSTTLATDVFGAPTRTVDALNRTTEIQRDLNSLPVRITRPNGSLVSFTYDATGNLLTSREQANALAVPLVTTFEHEPVFNQVTRIVDARRDATCPSGCATTIDYDATGNPAAIHDAIGETTALTYDPRGLLLTVTDALGVQTPGIPDDHQTVFTYDPVTGNLLTTTGPLNHVTQLDHDAAGNVTTSTDASLRTTTFAYDARNQLTSVIDADAKTTAYAYDPAGNLTAVTDANNRTTAFTYDSAALLTSTTNPLTQTKQFSYDLNRNLAQLLDAKGQTSTFTYDAANQLTEQVLTDALGTVQDTAMYAYDSLGSLTLVQDSDSKVVFEYDSLGRLARAISGEAGAPAFAHQVAQTITYSYDLAGNRTSLTCPQCAPLQYTYDALGHLTFIAGLPFFRKEFQYDALSRLTRLRNGVETTFAYDDASQLLSLASTLPGKLLAQVSYTYDPVGNRASLTDRFGLHQFGYDPLNRLLNADHPLASGLLDETFTYDPVGNRVTSFLSATHLHDAANRLLEDDAFTYTYDANGNLTSKTDKTTLQTTTYTYDVENQLVRVDLPGGGVVTYRYDGLGRRIEKDVAGAITRFLYDQEDLVGIFMGPTNCQTHTVFHGPGIDQPLAFLRDTNGDCSPFTDAVGFVEPRQDLVTDGLGSIVALTSELPGFLKIPFLAERVTYDSFGTPRLTGPGPDGTLDTADDVTLPQSAFGHPYAFTGREFDVESGLYYYRGRYYDPRTGRFLQADRVFAVNPYSYVGSVGKPLPYFKPVNETNPYLYTGNNPVNRIDPLGLWYVDVNFGVGWWGAVGTGGVIFSDKGIYSYGGGGGGTPGPAFGLTWSPFDPTPGWNFGLQGGWWVGGQVGTDIEGNRFWEVGVVTPGASVTGYYVEPFRWPWQKDNTQVCSEKKK